MLWTDHFDEGYKQLEARQDHDRRLKRFDFVVFEMPIKYSFLHKLKHPRQERQQVIKETRELLRKHQINSELRHSALLQLADQMLEEKDYKGCQTLLEESGVRDEASAPLLQARLGYLYKRQGSTSELIDSPRSPWRPG